MSTIFEVSRSDGLVRSVQKVSAPQDVTRYRGEIQGQRLTYRTKEYQHVIYL